MVSIGSPWRVIRTVIHLAVTGTAATDIVKAGAVALAVLLAVLLIRGLPGSQAVRELGAAGPDRPVRGVAFALALAWLFAWPYVLPWYDALGWALLPLVPLGPAASRASTGWPGGLAAAGPDRGARVRLPAGPADRRGAAGRARLAAARGQARGDPRGPRRRHRLAGGADGALGACGAVRTARASRRAADRQGDRERRRGEASEHRHRSPGRGRGGAAGDPRAGPGAWPGGWPAWPPWAATALGVLAWIAALAAVEPLVRGYLTSVPDQRMVDLNVYRTGGLSVLQGQPLYTVLTPPPQLLPFTYPPVAALFAVPLALLPWPAAQLAWVPFIYVPLAVVIWFAFAPLLRRVPPRSAARGGLRGHLRGLRLPVPDARRNAVRPGGHGAARDGRGGLRGPCAALAARRAGGARHRDQAGARGVHRVPVAVRAAARRGDRGGRGAGLDARRLAAAAR